MLLLMLLPPEAMISFRSTSPTLTSASRRTDWWTSSLCKNRSECCNREAFDDLYEDEVVRRRDCVTDEAWTGTLTLRLFFVLEVDDDDDDEEGTWGERGDKLAASICPLEIKFSTHLTTG